MYHRSVPVVWCRKRRPPRFLAFAHATLRKAAAAAVSGQPSGAMRAVGDDQRCKSKVLHIGNNHTANNRMGGFICTLSFLITLRTSKFRNQFTISSKYFDMACYLKRERPFLLLSLLRFSETTPELITFNHLRCHSSSTALGTRTGYWKLTRRGTDEIRLSLFATTPVVVARLHHLLSLFWNIYVGM